MTTAFSLKTFSPEDYNVYRPKYPKELFDHIYNYHKQSSDAKWDLVVDLGCGTGHVTTALTPPFTRAIGVDPSERMIEVAKKAHPEKAKDFIHGVSEDLRLLEDGSVDVIVSGERYRQILRCTVKLTGS